MWVNTCQKSSSPLVSLNLYKRFAIVGVFRFLNRFWLLCLSLLLLPAITIINQNLKVSLAIYIHTYIYIYINLIITHKKHHCKNIIFLFPFTQFNNFLRLCYVDYQLVITMGPACTHLLTYIAMFGLPLHPF